MTRQARSAPSLLRRILEPPFVFLAVIVILFEEWLWGWLTALGHWLAARLPVMKAVETAVDRMSPPFVGIIFVVPLALLAPLHIVCAWLFLNRHFVTGVLLLIAVKLTGTAVAARLFAIAKPKLMQLRSFAWAYGHVTRWIRFAHDYIEAQPAWTTVHAAIARIRRAVASVARPGSGWIARRFAAIKRRLRRRAAA